jgi:LacI family transcriptional regulator
LTDYTPAALRDSIVDVVLDQAPEAQAQRALDWMLYRIGLTKIEPDPTPSDLSRSPLKVSDLI